MSEIYLVSGREFAFETQETLMTKVSCWLEQNQPATRPQTVTELLSTVNNSWLAFDGDPELTGQENQVGTLLGHVGMHFLHHATGPQEDEGSMVYWTSLAEVSGLVVDSPAQGKGVGRRLLGRLVMQWQSEGSKEDVQTDGLQFALVDLVALACPASEAVFKSCGFSEADEQAISNKNWESRKITVSFRPGSKKPTGKLAPSVPGIRQFHHGRWSREDKKV
jgi:GNAT superfamily N-acetyltransferase